MSKSKNFIACCIILLAMLAGCLIGGFFDAKRLGVDYFEEKVHTVAVDDMDDLSEMENSFHNNVMTLEQDLTISEFCELATKELPFIGVFDGKGHTVTFTYETQYSLFGYIGEGGVVKNLNIIVKSTTFDNKKGGIFAIENAGRIENCTLTVQSAKVEVKGNYGGIVAINRGLIKNVVSNVSFENDMSAEEAENNSRITLGGVCAYNYGTINSCIAHTQFSKFDATDSQKIFDGTATNNSIGAIYGIRNKGELKHSNAILAEGVYVSDRNDKEIAFKKSKSEVYTDENLFVTLGFDENVWELVHEEFNLIQGD